MTVNTSGPNIGRLIDADLGDSFYLELTAFLRAFDGMAQPAVIDKDLAAPPGVLVNGARYLVAAGASGAWAGHEGHIARYYTSIASGSGWEFFVPRPGWQVAVLDELDGNSQPIRYSFNGSTWGASAGGGGGGGMANPMTAINDLIVGGNNGAPTRLGPPATTGFVLTFTAQGVAWAASQGGGGGGMTNPMTAKGDLIVGAASGAPTRLAVGNAAQVLTVLNDGTLGWVTPSGGGGSSFNGGKITNELIYPDQGVISAANTTALSTVNSNLVQVDGVSDITSFGAAQAGTMKFVVFTEAGTVLRNGNGLTLPTGADIPVRAGDSLIAVAPVADSWRVRFYQRKDGTALVGSSGGGGDFKKDGSVAMTGAFNEAPRLPVTVLSGLLQASIVAANTLTYGGNPYIDGLDVLPDGVRRTVEFTSTPILRPGTNFILPTAGNIQVAPGDIAEFVSHGAGVWSMLWYQRKDGTPLTAAVDNTRMPKAGGSFTGNVNFAPSVDLPSQDVCDLMSVDSNTIEIQGAATITSFGAGVVGATKFVSFGTSGVTLVNTAGKLSLPGNADILVAQYDSLVAQCVANNNWRVRFYQRKNGTPLVGGADPSKLPLAGGTMTGAINEAKMVRVPSGGTTNIGAANSNVVDLYYQDSNTISSFDNVPAGVRRIVTRTGRNAAGALNQDTTPITLVHNADYLVLPGAANIVMAIGDTIELESLGGGYWHALNYQRGNGQALVGAPDNTKLPLAGGTMTGPINEANATASIVAGKLTFDGKGNAAFLAGSSGTQISGVADASVVAAGAVRRVTFVNPGLVLVHSNSFVLPTAANITVRNLDSMIVQADDPNAWRVISYQRADGTALVSGAGFTEQQVRDTPLTGLVLTDKTQLSATDKVLAALGKLQAQLNSATFRVETIAATTVGQTSFAVPNGYVVGAVLVFFKGPLMGPADFTATDGTNIVLAVGADAVGDQLTVVVIGTVRAQDDALLSYSVAQLNAQGAAANFRKVRWCNNANGAPCMVVSDGTNWVRVSDNTIVTV
jgi:hypothetical protein